ncbi:MAG: NUDIX domain-containing protein [Patescibacteria group bacterium]|nr:NUDIX domain-containing protein [Patescibacteria group bacterium]MCL5257783.1 NUDIX domain-containing protein [Patescibacteria group bacterium]
MDQTKSQESERIKIKREISTGFIIFHEQTKGQRNFLLLKHSKHYWNAAKGHVEKGESLIAAAFREINEETGLKQKDLKIIPGFKAASLYLIKRKNLLIKKRVIFFLAQTNKIQIKISKEHQGYGWFNPDKIDAIPTFNDVKNHFLRAEKFLAKRQKLSTIKL